MFKIIATLIAATVFGCAVQSLEEPIVNEGMALPVTASAPCIQVTCDQATCNGALTITQTVPTNTGHVEVWAADLWASTGYSNYAPSTTVTQSAGQVITTTRVSGFRQNDKFCLLTGVVTRNAAGNVVGSAPVLNNGQLSLQPSAVTATVAP